MKKLAMFSTVMSLVMFFLANRTAVLYQSLDGHPITKVNEAIKLLPETLANNTFGIGHDIPSLVAGLSAAFLIWAIFLYNLFGAKKYMFGKEHGSAEWGNEKDIKKYKDKLPERNMLFTETEGMSLDTRHTLRNNNVLVIGGSGSGKTRFYVKPNLMQMHTSYVITDPKGELLRSSGKMLEKNGYKVKVFNLIHWDQSDKYNPFDYLTSEQDILKLINNLIRNTTPTDSKSNDPFWEKSETALLQALFGYVWYEAQPHEKNIGTIMELIRLAEVREEDEGYKSPLDILFDDLEAEKPNHFALKQYKIFKLAAGKTAKSILVSLGVRLAPFNIAALSDLMEIDTLTLDRIGEEK